jgi:hypothetical protein
VTSYLHLHKASHPPTIGNKPRVEQLDGFSWRQMLRDWQFRSAPEEPCPTSTLNGLGYSLHISKLRGAKTISDGTTQRSGNGYQLTRLLTRIARTNQNTSLSAFMKMNDVFKRSRAQPSTRYWYRGLLLTIFGQI